MKDSETIGSEDKSFKRKRKLVAIMLADIVGYTALMSKDEKKALRLLQKSRNTQKSLIKKSNGEWLKDIGDTTLSSFESAVEAVNCAVKIQRTLKNDKDLKLRIGLHVGDVVFAGGDVFGDGVNVASRIESLAGPGGIYISKHVHDKIKNFPNIETLSLGLKKLKNVEEPLEVYRVLVEKPVTKKMPEAREISELKSVAVLPFVDISPARDNEYFSDGITEEIITNLSRIRGLKVPSRTSLMRYKKTDKDIRQIGKELAVKYALEGSVRKHENRLRIAAQLIDVEDGFHVWADTYEGVLKDVFEFQEQVSRQITKALKVRLTENEENLMAEQATGNVRAYEHYLMGKYHLAKWTKQGIKSAIKLFEKALEFDPNYAPAYATIAMAYFAFVWGAVDPRKTWLKKADETVRKALSINENLPEAHYVLAWLYHVTGRPKEALQEVEKVITVEPNNCDALVLRGNIYIHQSIYEKAMMDFDMALSIDPLFHRAYYNRGKVLGSQQKYTEAIVELEKSLNIVERVPPLSWLLACYMPLANVDNVKLTVERILHIDPQGNIGRGALILMYAWLGEKKKMLELRAKEEPFGEFAELDPDMAVARATFHALVDEKDLAMRWLKKAVSLGNRDYRMFEVQPFLKKLHTDSKFKKLMKEIRERIKKDFGEF